MSDFINTYNNRKHEIQNFIIFMEYIENTEVNESDSKLHGFIHSPDNNLTYQSLINTLKSNFSLMLYNILEYTVSGLHDELYTEISINNLSYIDVSERIQTIWHKVKLNDANKNSAGFDTLLAKSKYILDSVINKNTITLSSRDTITGGNLDDKALIKIFDSHGIAFTKNYFRSDILGNIKTTRNDLAHGSVSFADALESSSISDLKEKSKIMINFLDDLIQSVKLYTDDKKYIKKFET